MSGGQTCNNTPRTFKVPRKSELNVLVTKQGCQPRQVRVAKKVGGGGGGGAAMAGSGAMLDPAPNPTEATLDCN